MTEISTHMESMLVRGVDLDRLLVLAGEVIIASSNQGIVTKGLHELYNNRSMVTKDILSETKDLSSSTSILSSDLHRLVQSIRTVDLKDLGFRARRLVRDISRKMGKRIDFEVIGEETTIDKAIIEKLYDPISHQLRNAVDHGIEDINTRLEHEKPEAGRLTLTIFNTEQETFIEIEDDGAGIDMEALHQKGVSKGLVKGEEVITEDIALDLMCSPGITTSKNVSDVSGRGVGMDVVKSQIESMDGTVSLKTEPSKGTTFTFRIPRASAVNIVDSLVVRADSTVYAFPISNVVATISVNPDDISGAFEKGEMIKYLGNLLPLYSLDAMIYRKENADKRENIETVSILIIEHKTRRIALEISEFIAPQKLVIIPFEESVSVTGLIGTTILGGRRLGFIVDVPSLMELTINKGTKGLKKSFFRKTDLTESEKSEISLGRKDHGEIDSNKFDMESTPFSEKETPVEHEFVIELEKLFPELNENIFSLESDPGNNDLINAVFRLFHTIKGNLIMMGLSKGGKTVHSVESILDQARGEKQDITPEMMDIIMDCVSYIEDIVKQMKAGEWKDNAMDDILERSKAMLPERPVKHEKITDVASAEIRFSHEAAYRLPMYRRNKNLFYQVYIEFESFGQPSFLVACLIYKRICEVGDILGTVPMLGDIEKGLMDGRIKILFTSNKPKDDLEKSLTDLFSKHYGASCINFSSKSY